MIEWRLSVFNWFDEFRDGVEAGIKTGIESGFKVLAESVKTGIDEWLKVPEPAEPLKLIRIFRPSATKPITQDGVTVEQDSWKIESYGERNVLLFEVAEPSLSECILVCQAQVKTAHLYKPAQLTLSSQNAAGWTFKKQVSVEGTTGWHLCKAPFHYKKERFTGSIQISVEFESGGVFWLKDVEMLQAAVKPSAQ